MEDEVGLRVCDWEGHRGTIRYIGSVADTKGVWYGVDWDDESRGKHNGSHNGEKYFWTWSKTSGSFVRRDKLRFGISFMEAIDDKYVKEDSKLLVRENVEDLKKSINAPFLELVGFEQVHEEQKLFKNLKIVSLMDTRLSNAGLTHNEILLAIPNIEDLDLSRTLVASWFAVGEITCQLKYLRCLNLSNNKLPVPNDMSGVMEQIFPWGHIHTLTLGNMDYIWADIVKLLAHFPVTCLKIPHNKITTLEAVPNMFLSLEELDLQENNIVDWSEINELGTLPKLKHLNLNNTRLRNIKLNPGSGLFPCLETLFISDNLIDSWDSVSQLHFIPSILTLRFTRNPVLSSLNPSAISDSREKTIARLRGLRLLNGSSIESSERRGVEYGYIKEFGALWLAGGEKRREFLNANPRYEELVNLHGPPLQEESTPAKAKDIITLNFKSEHRTISKKIPVTLTVAKLVNLIQHLFRNSGVLSIYYTSENKEQRIEMDVESLQEIGYYNLQEGDTIHVSFAE